MTVIDENHRIFESCELYGRHLPYERERAEFMAIPFVKNTSSNISKCAKSISRGIGSQYDKHIGRHTKKFRAKHSCLYSIFNGIWLIIVSLFIGIKNVLLCFVDFIFTRPTYADVQQGGLGDCYFLAALSSIARTNARHIKKHIRRHLPTAQWIRHIRTGDKRLFYDICFYGKTADNHFGKVWVTVDNVFKVQGDGQTWVHSDDCDGNGKQEIWVALYEKAYVKLRGAGDEEKGERVAGQGGTGLEAFPALLGKDAVALKFGDGPHELNNDQLRVVLAASSFIPMMAGTNGDNDKETISEGIVGGHMYSILGFGLNLIEGDYVLLRNPWAKFEPGSDETPHPFLIQGGDGVDDGVFRCYIKDFKKNYQYITCGDNAALQQVLEVAKNLGGSPSVPEIKFALKRMRMSNIWRKIWGCCHGVASLAKPRKNKRSVEVVTLP